MSDVQLRERTKEEALPRGMAIVRRAIGVLVLLLFFAPWFNYTNGLGVDGKGYPRSGADLFQRPSMLEWTLPLGLLDSDPRTRRRALITMEVTYWRGLIGCVPAGALVLVVGPRVRGRRIMASIALASMGAATTMLLRFIQQPSSVWYWWIPDESWTDESVARQTIEWVVASMPLLVAGVQGVTFRTGRVRWSVGILLGLAVATALAAQGLGWGLSEARWPLSLTAVLLGVAALIETRSFERASRVPADP